MASIWGNPCAKAKRNPGPPRCRTSTPCLPARRRKCSFRDSDFRWADRNDIQRAAASISSAPPICRFAACQWTNPIPDSPGAMQTTIATAAPGARFQGLIFDPDITLLKPAPAEKSPAVVIQPRAITHLFRAVRHRMLVPSKPRFLDWAPKKPAEDREYMRRGFFQMRWQILAVSMFVAAYGLGAASSSCASAYDSAGSADPALHGGRTCITNSRPAPTPQVTLPARLKIPRARHSSISLRPSWCVSTSWTSKPRRRNTRQRASALYLPEN